MWTVSHIFNNNSLTQSEIFGWPKDRIVKTLEKFGNTISASIPMALYEAVQDGRIKRGDRVLLIGTGAGLTTGLLSFTY